MNEDTRKTTDDTVKVTDSTDPAVEGTAVWEPPILTKLPAAEAETGPDVGGDGAGHS